MSTQLDLLQNHSLANSALCSPCFRDTILVPAAAVLLVQPHGGQHARLLCPISVRGEVLAAAGVDVFVLDVMERHTAAQKVWHGLGAQWYRFYVTSYGAG
jgi:hypothetical protein